MVDSHWINERNRTPNIHLFQEMVKRYNNWLQMKCFRFVMIRSVACAITRYSNFMPLSDDRFSFDQKKKSAVNKSFLKINNNSGGFSRFAARILVE